MGLLVSPNSSDENKEGMQMAGREQLPRTAPDPSAQLPDAVSPQHTLGTVWLAVVSGTGNPIAGGRDGDDQRNALCPVSYSSVCGKAVCLPGRVCRVLSRHIRNSSI